MKLFIRRLAKGVLKIFFPHLYYLENNKVDITMLGTNIEVSEISKANISTPANISNSVIRDFTYISRNSRISYTKIGKYCSIGPNFFCGWGIHPTNGISTSPVFYSTANQAGKSYSKEAKITERKPIEIGNDVFIGMNVTVLDGVKIGDGAVIGAGSVVSKDIPPYAIAVGTPIKIIRYRFDEEIIDKLLSISWWNFDEEKLKDVEQYFFDVESFVEKYTR